MLFYHFGYGKHRPARTGKRLRPQLVMRAALHEGGDLEDALDAAAAVELLHNYSLVHDDIEDGDQLRRGRPTLWSVYGIPLAINAGDALCALTFLTLLKTSERHPVDRVVAMMDMLHEAHRVMCEGQSLDIEFETAPRVSLDRYYEMIEGKTAALFEASCMLGAHCAHAPLQRVRTYGEMGRAYGIAFQIRDDILGIWASVDETGKIAQNDLARRKWTFPIAWALAQPPSSARAAVAQAYESGGTLGPDSVSRVMDALETLGAREAAARAVEEQVAVVEQANAIELRDYMLNTLAESVG
jgi:geranylgeranyl diphosphate synthase, type I